MTLTKHNLLTPQQRQAALGKVRRSFERGLLALIVDEDRQRGLVTLQHVARGLMELQPSSQASLDDVVRWLNAIRHDQLQMTEDTFTILRGLGQIIRSWELVIIDGESEFSPDTEFRELAAGARGRLQQVSPSSGEVVDSADTETGDALLRSLDQSLSSMQILLQEWLTNLEDPAKIAAVGQGFRALRELSYGERLADVAEVAWAIENMLDRLVDETLVVSGDFHVVSMAAIDFLLTLSSKLSQISAAEGISSFIDDYIYAEIIESADILASGGELGAKSQEFEEDFPSDPSLDQRLDSLTKDESNLAIQNASASGLTLSLEQTMEVFQAANRSLDVALVKFETSLASEAGMQLSKLLREQLTSSQSVSDKLRALVAIQEQ
ncbi:MAG: hypothetical protein ACI8RT_001024 [Candidatus Azotimanducaceae bacterium]